MGKLSNKVAVITGGARGLGFAAAEKFMAEGATVVLWDLDADKLTEAVAQLKAQSSNVSSDAVNVADYAAVQQAAQAVVERHGRIDILINNAGITADATLKKMTPEQWQKVIDVNLTGVFNCTQVIANHMLTNQYGRIISTASVVALYGNFGQTNYVASKAGIIGMTKVWARELGRKGITVNAVAPGFIATEMVQSVPEKVLQMMIDKTPVGRLGEPEDIANAYLFLASDDASYINGTTLSVDGGLTL